MRRRDFLTASAILAGTAAGSRLLGRSDSAPAAANRIEPPKDNRIPVAITISTGVTVIDFSGPWEVFQDAWVSERGEEKQPFQLYTVSETLEPVRGSAGLRIVPDFTFATAPPPRVVVVPAQKGSPALHDWLRRNSQTADVTMSVCTGAFQLARAGLLSGREATTHHDSLDRLAAQYPDVRVKRGVRYVEGPRISTAGGLSSGIDLALRVVERYYGRPTADRTADYMEYQRRS